MTDAEKTQRTARQHGAALDDQAPISHLYLSFDSDLPLPPGQPPSISAPDLRRYTSPYTWSHPHKLVVLALGCVSTFLTAYTAGSYSPPATYIAADLGTTPLIVLLGITTFCIGFALAPMVLAPVSEIWGRYPVLVAAGVFFSAFQIACAHAPNLAAMFMCRFLVGCGASVFSSIVGGVIADVFSKEDRNTPMAIYSGFVLGGTGAGPLVCASIVEALGDTWPSGAWKWCFWHQGIADGLLVLALATCFRETRGSVLLSRKARKLNEWYDTLEKQGIYGVWVKDSELTAGASASSAKSTSDESRTLCRLRWKVQADEERGSLGSMMATSVLRPFYMLGTEPVVLAFSVWAAFSWAVLYLGFAVVPYLHRGDFAASYPTYAAMMVGAALATTVSVFQERLLENKKWTGEERTMSLFWLMMRRRFPRDAPEARLYFCCVTALLLPIGLFVAFMPSQTALPGDQGILLAVGIGLATWGIYVIYLASFNYTADAYHIYASSALAANGFCRNVLGGSFPVLTGLMFDGMGVRGGGAMLGSVAIVLGFIPIVLVTWGARIRSRSMMATMLQKS
ncbi:putative MFS-type transporter-like protein [Emericellopsis cladophorae]|uniref:MFS-type transporter-like protein n=1 Tax=Emericellopsis cladophorae TaxID=2686198 RepID=A0A9Q0BE63_9HYPO|nr:putative MFS-type transporter-like protein [Emericellopsis cladophorae]KAI6781295.1 putative MFS-type transporter-like protein [Emericellopsis cladophorae]